MLVRNSRSHHMHGLHGLHGNSGDAVTLHYRERATGIVHAWAYKWEAYNRITVCEERPDGSQFDVLFSGVELAPVSAMYTAVTCIACLGQRPRR